MMTNRFPRLSPNNCFQKRPMCSCPHADVTGWTLDYVRSYAQEARVCIISNSTILLRVLMTNYLMSCCRYLRIPLMRIKRSLRLLRLLQINRNHPPIFHLNYSPNMSACAHRLHKYLPLIRNRRCREHRSSNSSEVCQQ